MSNPTDRQEYNRMIADLIIAGIERFPEQRFGQILRNLEIIKEVRDEKGLPVSWVNEFNLEPDELLLRVGKYTEIMRNLGAVVSGNSRMYAKRLQLLKKYGKQD